MRPRKVGSISQALMNNFGVNKWTTAQDTEQKKLALKNDQTPPSTLPIFKFSNKWNASTWIKAYRKKRRFRRIRKISGE